MRDPRRSRRDRRSRRCCAPCTEAATTTFRAETAAWATEATAATAWAAEATSIATEASAAAPWAAEATPVATEATTTAARAAGAAAARTTILSLSNGQCSPGHLETVHLANRVLAGLLRLHFDEAETTAPTGFPVGGDFHGHDGPMWGE